MYRAQMKNSACVGCVHLQNFHLEVPFSRYISFLNDCRTGKSTSHFWIFSLIFREKLISVGITFQVEKVFTQILHVLHVKTTVGHRDLSQMASCQVWLSIVGVYCVTTRKTLVSPTPIS